MSNEKQNISVEEFKTQLGEQKQVALTNANELIREKIDTMAQWAKGEHVIVPMNMVTDGNVMVYNDPVMKAYLEKANELTREFEKLGNQEQRDYLLARQNLIFANWQRRLTVILDLNDKDNRDPDLNEIRNRGVALIKSISIPEFMAQNLRGSLREAYIQEIEAQGKKVAPDLTDTLQRLGNGEIKPEDWIVIVEHLRNLSTSGKDWMETSASMAIVGAIPPHLRPQLLHELRNAPNPRNITISYEEVVLNLLVNNYLTVAQVEAVVKAQIETAKAEHKSTTALEALLVKIQNPKLLKTQEKMEAAQVEGVKRLKQHRQVGHTNSMRQVLTFEGVAGTLVAVNGLTTVLANVLMNLSPEDWSNIPSNPAVWMGLGMMGAGLELNNGFGGMMDTPSTQIGQLLEDKEAQADQERLMNQNAFEREVMRYPRAQELYFQFVQEINTSYEKKSRETHSAQVGLTMEEIGIDWESLPAEYRTMNQENTEALLSQWVTRMAGNKALKQSVDTQKSFMGGDPSNTKGAKSDCRVKYGLAPLEEWSPERKKEYSLI